MALLKQKDHEIKKLHKVVDKYHSVLKDHDLTDLQITKYVHVSDSELHSDSDGDCEFAQERESADC